MKFLNLGFNNIKPLPSDNEIYNFSNKVLSNIEESVLTLIIDHNL